MNFNPSGIVMAKPGWRKNQELSGAGKISSLYRQPFYSSPGFIIPLVYYRCRGCCKRHKSLEPRRTRRAQRKRKALLCALRVLRGSLLFRAFWDTLRGGERGISTLALMQGPQHTLADTSWPLIASLYAMVHLCTEQELNC